MDVFVTDQDDKPVTGLTVNDFEVFENKRPQVITTFAEVKTPIVRQESLPFETQSDVQTNARPIRHIYLIIAGLDDLRVRHLVRQFITDHVSDDDVVAIATGGGLATSGQDFTSNRSLLFAALDRGGGEGGGNPQDMWDRMEVMARIPGGRKSVLWFGDSFPDAFDITEYRGGVLSINDEYAHATVSAATRANIRIYPIDPVGLTTGLGSIEGRMIARKLADLTGGFAQVGSNTFGAAFDRIEQETSSYYVLGFDSATLRKQGRHIELDVRVKRPGLKVRSRSGYVEQLEDIRAIMPPEPKRTPVEEALANPLATTGVTMRVTAAPFRQSGRTSTVALAVEVDPETLRFTERNGRYLATFEIRHLATDSRKKIHPEYRHRGSLDLDARSYKQLLQTGIRLVSQFELPEGRYQVRVASARGTRNGGVVYDLVVPDFTKEPFAMSGVALTTLTAAGAPTFRPDRNQREKQATKGCHERVCAAEVTFGSVLVPYSSKVAPSERPLLSDVLPAPPATTRAFTASDTLALFAEVYDNEKSGRKDSSYAITLTATLHNTESIVVRQVSEERDAKAARRKSGGHGFTLKLPLEGLAAGSYVLRVEARSGRDETHTVSRSIPIRVK
jgi:VWFA-related protein